MASQTLPRRQFQNGSLIILIIADDGTYVINTLYENVGYTSVYVIILYIKRFKSKRVDIRRGPIG